MDHPVPGKALASGGENVTDEARRFRVDVAVRADKSKRNRSDPSHDQLDAWIEAVALDACLHLLLIERRELQLLRKRERGRLVAVARDEDTADDQHGIVWRRNLRHAFRHNSLPAGPT